MAIPHNIIIIVIIIIIIIIVIIIIFIVIITIIIIIIVIIIIIIIIIKYQQWRYGGKVSHRRGLAKTMIWTSSKPGFGRRVERGHLVWGARCAETNHTQEAPKGVRGVEPPAICD